MGIDEVMSSQSQTAPAETTTQTQEKGWEERFRSFLKRGWFNDLDETITLPNFRFNINGVDCVPSGEITAISGKAGAGKSTTLAIFVGVLISRTDFADIRCVTPCKKVLWVDTEKGEYTCKQKMSVFRRVAKIDKSKRLEEIGVNFALMRQEITEDRVLFIDALAQLDKYDAIVIDGIFDMTKDPDKEYSTVTDLMRRLADSGASVFVMLHTNKNDDNMRYALGTETQRLCTTRFDVEYDKQTGRHIIKHVKSNDSALAPDVAFVFDENGSIIPASESPEVKAKQEASLEELRTLFKNCFGKAKTLRNSEIKNLLMSNYNISSATANRRIVEAKTKEILILKGRDYCLSDI